MVKHNTITKLSLGVIAVLNGFGTICSHEEDKSSERHLEKINNWHPSALALPTATLRWNRGAASPLLAWSWWNILRHLGILSRFVRTVGVWRLNIIGKKSFVLLESYRHCKSLAVSLLHLSLARIITFQFNAMIIIFKKVKIFIFKIYIKDDMLMMINEW